MRDLVILFVVVLLVYFFQCLCWAPKRAVVFSLEPAGKTGRRKRGFLWSALNLTGYWCNPLPPLQPVLVIFWPAFQPGPETLQLSREDAELITVPWDKLSMTRSGTKLLCNGVVVFQGGADQLQAYQEFLQKLKYAKVKERSKLIERWLQKSTNPAAVEERIEQFRNKSRWLELAVNLQFFFLFALVPLAFFRFGNRALWPSVAGVLAASIFIAWQFWRLHKAFFPSDGEARFKSLFSAVLSPIYAIRAVDALAKELLSGFHPSAVAAVVCSPQEFEALAGEQLRTNKFGSAGKSWYREQLELVLAQMMAKKGLEASRLLAAPEQEENCVVYCPRCRAQYTKTREACADCGFEHLADFDSPSNGKRPEVTAGRQ